MKGVLLKEQVHNRTTMKAAVLEAFGLPLIIQEVPDPQLGTKDYDYKTIIAMVPLRSKYAFPPKTRLCSVLVETQTS